jgi:hypothetical protein
MEVLNIQIINPKVKSLLLDLAEMELIRKIKFIRA